MKLEYSGGTWTNIQFSIRHKYMYMHLSQKFKILINSVSVSLNSFMPKHDTKEREQKAL